MKFQRTNGGRPRSWPKPTGDCVCRAIATATGIPYMAVYGVLKPLGCGHPNSGIDTGRAEFARIMLALRFRFVKLRHPIFFDQLPATGTRIVVSEERAHVAAVKNGTYYDRSQIMDAWDRVYGYWLLTKRRRHV
jgi:hypothetical protein